MVLYDLQLKEIVLILSGQGSVHPCSQRSQDTIMKIFSCGQKKWLIMVNDDDGDKEDLRHKMAQYQLLDWLPQQTVLNPYWEHNTSEHLKSNQDAKLEAIKPLSQNLVINII